MMNKKIYEFCLYIFLVLPFLPSIHFFKSLKHGLLLATCISLFVVFLLIKYGKDKLDYFRNDSSYPYVIYAWVLFASIGGATVSYGTDLLGAFNPQQYFQNEIAKHGAQNCETFSILTKSASDSLRVSVNKFNMGIETISDLEASRNSYKFLNDSLNNCLSDEQKTIDNLQAKLDNYLKNSH